MFCWWDTNPTPYSLYYLIIWFTYFIAIYINLFIHYSLTLSPLWIIHSYILTPSRNPLSLVTLVNKSHNLWSPFLTFYDSLFLWLINPSNIYSNSFLPSYPKSFYLIFFTFLVLYVILLISIQVYWVYLYS